MCLSLITFKYMFSLNDQVNYFLKSTYQDCVGGIQIAKETYS